MALTKTPDARFVNDKEQSERSARAQLEFILANKTSLMKIMNGRKYAMTADELSNNKEKLTDNQKSYVDVIYERTMKSLHLPYFTTTFKPKRGRV